MDNKIHPVNLNWQPLYPRRDDTDVTSQTVRREVLLYLYAAYLTRCSIHFTEIFELEFYNVMGDRKDWTERETKFWIAREQNVRSSLLNSGLIYEASYVPETRRRYYRLTEKGIAKVEAMLGEA